MGYSLYITTCVGHYFVLQNYILPDRDR